MSHVTRHMSHIMCHVSCVTCHASHVFFFFSFFGQSGEAYRLRVCYKRGLPRPVVEKHGYTGSVNNLRSLKGGSPRLICAIYLIVKTVSRQAETSFHKAS